MIKADKIINHILKVSGRGNEDMVLRELLRHVVLIMGTIRCKYIGDKLVKEEGGIGLKHQLNMRQISGIEFPESKTLKSSVDGDLDSKSMTIPITLSLEDNVDSVILDISDARIGYIMKSVLGIDADTRFLKVKVLDDTIEIMSY
jgi:hypothetical protein